MQPTTRPLPELMWSLGYGGLLPFLALSAALMYETSLPGLENVRLDWWLAAYAAIILSFLGAVHWGVTLGMLDKLEQRERTHLLLFSVVPGVLTWFALLLPIQGALFALAGLVTLVYVADTRLLFRLLPDDYRKMRRNLTIAVTCSLIASGIVAG